MKEYQDVRKQIFESRSKPKSNLTYRMNQIGLTILFAALVNRELALKYPGRKVIHFDSVSADWILNAFYIKGLKKPTIQDVFSLMNLQDDGEYITHTKR